MSIYTIDVEKMDGTKQNLEEYQESVMLIVNTASKCGHTPQFSGLEKIYNEYKEKGVVILGFPCNQFLRQDPKSNEDILAFCKLNYGVTFPMFAKLDVKGKNQAPLYSYLVENTGGKAIEWNFAKFLIDQKGTIIKRYHPKVQPETVEEDILALLS